MSKDFNVYKWRREQLLTEYRTIVNGFRDEKTPQTTEMYDPNTNKYVDKKYDGYYSIQTTGQFFDASDSYHVFNKEVLPLIKEKGYTFVGNDAAEGSSLSIRHYFYYTKPESEVA